MTAPAKLPLGIDADKARAACEWHKHCVADVHVRHALSLENAINLKLACGPHAAVAVARWWLEQNKPLAKAKSVPTDNDAESKWERAERERAPEERAQRQRDLDAVEQEGRFDGRHKGVDP